MFRVYGIMGCRNNGRAHYSDAYCTKSPKTGKDSGLG